MDDKQKLKDLEKEIEAIQSEHLPDNQDIKSALEEIGESVRDKSHVEAIKKAAEDAREAVQEQTSKILIKLESLRTKEVTHLDVTVKNPQEKVEVSNLKDIHIPEPVEEVHIKKANWLLDSFDDLRTAVKAVGDKILRVTVVNHDSPEKAIAVRLVDKDGRKFVNPSSGVINGGYTPTPGGGSGNGGGGDASAANQVTMISHIDGVEGLLSTVAGAVSGAEMQVDVITMPTVTVNPQPNTTGGLSIARDIDLDEGTLTVIKNSPGQVYGMWVTNTATSTRWIKFYDATSGTAGTGTPVITIGIPGNTSDDIAGNFGPGGMGIAFATGICVGATTAVADADTGAPSANDVIINVFYK